MRLVASVGGTGLGDVTASLHCVHSRLLTDVAISEDAVIKGQRVRQRRLVLLEQREQELIHLLSSRAVGTDAYVSEVDDIARDKRLAHLRFEMHIDALKAVLIGEERVWRLVVQLECAASQGFGSRGDDYTDSPGDGDVAPISHGFAGGDGAEFGAVVSGYSSSGVDGTPVVGGDVGGWGHGGLMPSTASGVPGSSTNSSAGNNNSSNHLIGPGGHEGRSGAARGPGGAMSALGRWGRVKGAPGPRGPRRPPLPDGWKG